jgi:NADH-quinone oxidoreductase subunit H
VIADSSVFDSVIGGYWVALILKAAVVLGVFLIVPLAVGYMEHKVLAHMQARVGPMEAGVFHGWAQLMADGVKFIQKEDVVPAAADPGVFSLAPAVVMIPYIVTLVAIPFGPRLYALDLDVGVFFVLAMSSIGVIGVLMAGWASANKYSLIGALRAAAQLIAYELPLVLVAAAIVMQAGSMSLLQITEAQSHHWNVVYPWQAVGFVIFMIAAVAELTRPPFDMPVADSEIIFGAYTEYTGLKFAFFLLAEYGGIVVMSAIAAVLYLGGFQPLGGLSVIPGVLWMFGKIFALSFVIIWLRATFPRLREDQLQRFAWIGLTPLALAIILITAFWQVWRA